MTSDKAEPFEDTLAHRITVVRELAVIGVRREKLAAQLAACDHELAVLANRGLCAGLTWSQILPAVQASVKRSQYLPSLSSLYRLARKARET